MKTLFENIKSKPLFTSSSFSLLLFQIFHYGLFSLRILLPRPLLCSFSVVFELVAWTSKLDNFHVHPWEIWWKRFWFFHSFPLCQDQHTVRKKMYIIDLGFRLVQIMKVILSWKCRFVVCLFWSLRGSGSFAYIIFWSIGLKTTS